MINSSTLVGRLTRDPELNKTPSGKSVVSFTLAVNRQFNKEETDFINIVAWNGAADFVGNYINKGDLVGVTGSIQTRNYENSNGDKVYVTEVLANSVQGLGSKKDTPQREERVEDEQVADITSDDLPF